MHVHFHLFGRELASYGLCIVLGVGLANLLAVPVVRKFKLNIYELIILEAFTAIGVGLGAKLLFFAVSAPMIDWSRIFEWDYLRLLLEGGFVFYGGLLGGLVFYFWGGKLFKIDAMRYAERIAFLIPLGHAFGRLGCFMAGCCYGIPYDGPGAVIFPADSYAIPGIPLFPVQLLEAALLLLIFLFDGYMTYFKEWDYTIEAYLLLYGLVRFFDEFLRFDAIRGIYFGISTSQWISLFVAAVAVGLALRKIMRKRRLAVSGG